MSKIIGLAIGAGLLAASAGLLPAEAAGVKIGVLNCNVEKGWGYVLGSSKEVNCSYTSSKGLTEHYTGSISKIGVDVGYTKGGVLIWDVIAPSADVKHGALQGEYGGVSASATVVVGVGANVLLGGFDKSVALQPVSIEGNTGLNVAAGISGLKLKSVP